ncbi:MAG: hypothetical protein H7Z74_17975 [Anaerolineae bacterium]|nr:hypothetical protein [Gemmatimonadaceae bacterium]
MPTLDLGNFSLVDTLRCQRELRGLGKNAKSMEIAARELVRFFYEETRDPASGDRACALVRFYKTQAFGTLTPALQRFAGNLVGQNPIDEKTKCLVLLATVGDEPAWNSRHESRGHQAIPLLSVEVVKQAPMIAQLINDFGFELSDVVESSSEILRNRAGKSYGVFHVPEAVGSPFIPAQSDFVAPHGVRSVLGFGGLLPAGDLFATIMFSRTHIPTATADRFKTLALDVRSLLFLFRSDEVFADEKERRP